MDRSERDVPRKWGARRGASKIPAARKLLDSIYPQWRMRSKNKRQSAVKDFHDAMNRSNNRLAFAIITAH